MCRLANTLPHVLPTLHSAQSVADRALAQPTPGLSAIKSYQEVSAIAFQPAH